jgi:predicted phosphodiesterase
MKLHILSDLHLDFAPFRPLDPLPLAIDADVVILAGDLCNGPQGARWAKAAFADKPVIYVAGNHEFYNSLMGGVIHQIREETAGSNVHFLDNEEIVIDGVRFLGATLWTDFEIEGEAWRDIAMDYAKRNMSDFSLIKMKGGKPMTPAQSRELHNKSLRWLNFKLSEPFDGETVVVTHHGCSKRSIHEKWKGQMLNGAFTSNLDDMLGRCKLWVHGHTHDNFDYDADGTRVIVNPRGYCRSNFHKTKPLGAPLVEKCENPAFNPFLVVEI